jgi:SEC-C motif-containing protein
MILHLDGHVRWTGLDVLATAGGTRFSLEGAVQFCAHDLDTGRAGAQHEDSRFVRDGGQWRFLEARPCPEAAARR